MPNYVTEIVADLELNAALSNFSTVCAANSAALGLTPADLTAISGAATAFNTTLTTAVASKATTKANVESKDLQKKASKAIVSKWAKVFRANVSVPDNLLEQLMLPKHKTPGTKTPPTQPMNLVGNADTNGLVALKWGRNGNTSTTTFLIETRTDPGAAWSISGSTTKVKFNYQAVPGSYIAFRVTAARGDLQSPPSVPFVMWENGGQGVSLSLAA